MSLASLMLLTLAMALGLMVACRAGEQPSPIVIAVHAGVATIGYGLLTGAI